MSEISATGKRSDSVPWGWIPWGLCILAFAIRFTILNRFLDSPFFSPDSGDTAFYNDWALRILAGTFTDGQAFYGLPGYAWLLAGIYAVCGYTPYAPALLQCVAEAATAWVIYAIGVRMFSRDAPSAGSSGDPLARGAESEALPGVSVPESSDVPRDTPRSVEDSFLPLSRGDLTGTAILTGALASLAWIFFIPAQAFSIVLMPTCYAALAYWSLALWVMRVDGDDRAPTMWTPLWMGTIAGFTAMFVATILFVLPLAIVAFARKLRRPRAILATAVLFAGLLLGCAPCWMHNYFIAGEPVMLSAHSGINFYVGNNAEATGYPKIPSGLRSDQAGMLKDSVLVAEREVGRPLRRVEVSEFWSAKAKRHIAEHPGAWLRLMGRKVRNLLNGYQYDDLSLIALLRSLGILLPGVGFGALAVFALPGAFVLPFVARRSLWVAGAVVLYMAALLPVFVTERYRLPMAPGLALLAAGGLVALWVLFARRRWRLVGGYFGVLVLAVIVVRWPVATPEMLALDQYNLGGRALRVGELGRAALFLDKAYALSPDSAEVNFALGNLALERKERDKAKSHYRRTLELDPRHASAYNNLGVMAEEEDRLELARGFFSKSIEFEPDDAKSWYLLARVSLRLGERTVAAAAVARAIDLAPEQPLFQELREEIEQGGE